MELAELGGRFHRNANCAPEERVKGFDPKHLARKYRSEVPRDRFGDGVQVERRAEFLLHRGDRLGRDAAGDDQVEVAEVGVYVYREAVRGDEARDVDADGG